jgi:hypothetical protein
MIHTVGDSHSWFGWKDIKEYQYPIKINRIGAKLMYTFSKDREKVISPFIYDSINKNDILIYCFGEIDCRCHISKHITKDVDYVALINRLSTDYLEAVRYMHFKYMPQGAKSAVYSVVPPIKERDGTNNPDYPFLGSDQDRLQYHRYLNERLRLLCENDIIFFDITSKYEDENGFLETEKSDRRCHIDNPQGILDTIYEMNISLAKHNQT